MYLVYNYTQFYVVIKTKIRACSYTYGYKSSDQKSTDGVKLISYWSDPTAADATKFVVQMDFFLEHLIPWGENEVNDYGKNCGPFFIHCSWNCKWQKMTMLHQLFQLTSTSQKKITRLKITFAATAPCWFGIHSIHSFWHTMCYCSYKLLEMRTPSSSTVQLASVLFACDVNIFPKWEFFQYFPSEKNWTGIGCVVFICNMPHAHWSEKNDWLHPKCKK